MTAQSPTTVPTPEPPAYPSVYLSCTKTDNVGLSGGFLDYKIVLDAQGRPDFTGEWKDNNSDCIMDQGGHTASSPVELAAIGASGSGDDASSIDDLYIACAERFNSANMFYGSLLGGLVGTYRGAMVLCPNHPDGKAIRSAIRAQDDDTALRAKGRRFSDGTYRVGSEVQPGTYTATDVENCYWERQDSSGNIIDNNFIAAAKRVQVTIYGSDYGFHSEHCGPWTRV